VSLAPAFRPGPTVSLNQVVPTRLEVAETIGEHVEGTLDRCLHHDLLADHRVCCLGHVSSSVESSIAAS
jgi:hypothetical protein